MTQHISSCCVSLALCVRTYVRTRIFAFFFRQRPKTPAASLLSKVRGMGGEEKAEKKRQDADMLANSILNHQANSITQVLTKS